MLALLSFGCEPDDKPEPSYGTVKLVFHNVVDQKNLELDKMQYLNAEKNEYSVSKLLYYISNIKLDGCDDCGIFTEKESYHLIRQLDDPLMGGQVYDNEITINNVPNGNYKKLQFGVGVDATRNTSGSQTGALDPLNDMFWGWATGYIFFKVEGDWNQSDTAKGNFIFHVGGDAAYRETELLFDESILVNENQEVTIDIYANLNKAFSNKTNINFYELSTTVSPSNNANQIADNYIDMFSTSKP